MKRHIYFRWDYLYNAEVFITVFTFLGSLISLALRA